MFFGREFHLRTCAAERAQLGAEMKLSRSSILTVLAVLILMVALPDAIQRLFLTGDPYLFTRQFFKDIFMRFSGIGRLRFVVQPTAALLLGMRDGVRDSHLGNPPFVWGVLFHRLHRPDLLRGALTSIRDLIAIAVILDIVFQFLLFREVHPAAALLVGPVLIAVPYSVSRALANRVARTRTPQKPIAHSN